MSEVDFVLPLSATHGSIEGGFTHHQLEQPTTTPLLFVVGHPYGPLGGDMNNNVTMGVCDYLTGQGHAVIRFNFRGSGKSSGKTSWTAEGEKDDLRAVIEYAIAQGYSNIITIGYSYSALVVASVFDSIPQVLAAAFISLPYSVTWFLSLFQGSSLLSPLATSSKPKLFIHGYSDSFTGLPKFQAEMERVAEPRMVALCGANHFWGGQENLITDQLQKWLDAFVPTLSLTPFSHSFAN